MNALALLAAMGALAAGQPSAKEDALWSKLKERIEAVERGLDGVLGVFAKDLKSGRTLEIRSDQLFPTASAIKPAVLYELYRQAEEGKLDLGELTRPPVPRVRGGGVLQELGDKVSLTWRDLAILMIGWSDNEATNLLIGRVGRENVNRRLETLGCPSTRLRRKMMDLDAARRGEENVATPADLARLMEAIYRGSGLSPERAKDLLAVASAPKWGSGAGDASPFRTPLPEALRVADKPGELEGVRCVAAAVDLPQRPYVAVIMATYLRREADGDAAIREISARLFETLDRLARASEHGRIVSER